jgi:hypothetical protein
MSSGHYVVPSFSISSKCSLKRRSAAGTNFSYQRFANLDPSEGEEAIKQWLRREIDRLEKELAPG